MAVEGAFQLIANRRGMLKQESKHESGLQYKNKGFIKKLNIYNVIIAKVL